MKKIVLTLIAMLSVVGSFADDNNNNRISEMVLSNSNVDLGVAVYNMQMPASQAGDLFAMNDYVVNQPRVATAMENSNKATKPVEKKVSTRRDSVSYDISGLSQIVSPDQLSVMIQLQDASQAK